jgi:hypothetical protein
MSVQSAAARSLAAHGIQSVALAGHESWTFPPLRKMDSAGIVSAKVAASADSSIGSSAAREESRSHHLGFMSAPLLAAPGTQANPIQAASGACTCAGGDRATIKIFHAAPVTRNRGQVICASDLPKFPAIAAYSIGQSERHTAFPEEPIAKKKDLLFSDDFGRAEIGKARGSVVPAFSDREWRLAWSQAPRAAAAFCRVIVRRFGYPARMVRALHSASKFHLLRAS